MRFLYSLDISFCSRITSSSIVNLLEMRQGSLTELRLQNCRHLDITRDTIRSGSVLGSGQAGQNIVNALRSSRRPSELTMLDVRNCGGYQRNGYPGDDPFVQGMVALRFKQVIPGFFQRPSKPNSEIIKNLIDQEPQDYAMEL